MRAKHVIAMLWWAFGCSAVVAQDAVALARQCEAAQQIAPGERIAACTRMLGLTAQNPRAQAMVYTNRAWPYSLQGRFDLAMADLDQALRLQPNSAIVLNDRGFTFLRMGRLDLALANYNAALQSDPGTVYALYGRGIVQARQGHAAAAQVDLDAARRLQPGVDAFFEGLGVKPSCLRRSN